MTVDSILKAIKTGIQESLSQVKPDKTYIGTITKVLDDKEFVVNYDGNDRTIKTKYVLPLAIGDVAHVTVPRDNVRNIYLLEDIAYGIILKSETIQDNLGSVGTKTFIGSEPTQKTENMIWIED